VTREEGFMVGGSSGTAIAGLMKIADRFHDNDVVVVLLPDSGERYLSKIFSDNWMRENGFLSTERVTADTVLRGKGGDVRRLVSVDSSATIRTALDLIRANDVSQVPVLDRTRPVGALHDYELMRVVLETPALADAPVSQVMAPCFPSVPPATPIDEVIRLMTTQHHSAILIEEDGTIRGILTRYDVVEFMSKGDR
jgi:cystathionine beta-synthase